jgi:hypothetical protein
MLCQNVSVMSSPSRVAKGRCWPSSSSVTGPVWLVQSYCMQLLQTTIRNAVGNCTFNTQLQLWISTHVYSTNNWNVARNCTVLYYHCHKYRNKQYCIDLAASYNSRMMEWGWWIHAESKGDGSIKPSTDCTTHPLAIDPTNPWATHRWYHTHFRRHKPLLNGTHHSSNCNCTVQSLEFPYCTFGCTVYNCTAKCLCSFTKLCHIWLHCSLPCAILMHSYCVYGCRLEMAPSMASFTTFAQVPAPRGQQYTLAIAFW